MLLYLPLAMSVENDKQSSECFHYLFSFRAGAASMPNIPRATFTLSIRTVDLPCSRSRTKRRPSPERMANSSWVSPASFLLFFTNSAIGFIFSIFLFLLSTHIIYTLRYNVKRLLKKYTRKGIFQATWLCVYLIGYKIICFVKRKSIPH